MSIGNKLSELFGIRSKQVSLTQQTQTSPRKDPNIIQIPGRFFPHANFKNALWIKFAARELTGINTGRRGGNLRLGRKGATFKFLAPESVIDTHNHTWEPYSSIQSALLKKIVSFSVGSEQIKQIYQSLNQDINALINSKNFPGGQQIVNILQRATAVDVPKYKIDTPLSYRDSARRQYTLAFILADIDGTDIERAVKTIQKYSAPESKSSYRIEWPWIFNVKSEPEGLIDLEFAAINSIITNWMGPYVNGKPIRCELTLTFTDMKPLFKDIIDTTGIVNVNMNTGEAQYDYHDGQVAWRAPNKQTYRQQKLGV